MNDVGLCPPDRILDGPGRITDEIVDTVSYASNLACTPVALLKRRRSQFSRACLRKGSQHIHVVAAIDKTVTKIGDMTFCPAEGDVSAMGIHNEDAVTHGLRSAGGAGRTCARPDCSRALFDVGATRVASDPLRKLTRSVCVAGGDDLGGFEDRGTGRSQSPCRFPVTPRSVARAGVEPKPASIVGPERPPGFSDEGTS